MADASSDKRISRRKFLIASAAPLALTLLPGCKSLKSGTSNAALIAGSGFNDHPLGALTFPPQSIVKKTMHFEVIDTPARIAEGRTINPLRGTNAYPYLLPDESDKRSKVSPPRGIRSAVPIGGLGSGTIELKGDGSLAAWDLFNDASGNRASETLDDAFFAIRTQVVDSPPQVFALRTHTAEPLRPVSEITYTGSFPVSRLQASDPALPLDVVLYGYGSFKVNDAVASTIPSAMFSIVIANPTSQAIDTSVMFCLPNQLEGTYRTERGLLLSRSGQEQTSGEICMAFDSDLSVSSMVTSDLSDLWHTFERNGSLNGQASLGLFEYGALAKRFIIEPNSSRAITLVLSWHFPHRFIAGEAVGNQYTHRFPSATDANQTTLHRLPETWRSIQSWQSLYTQNSLPPSIQQGLGNSIAHFYKNTFITANNNWASWDAGSSPTLSSIESQFYRAIPELIFTPDALKDYLRALATRQDATGRFPSSLGYGSKYALNAAPISEQPATAPLYFILAYLYFQFTGNVAFLKELWPHILKALDWQSLITTPEGLPSNLPDKSYWPGLKNEGILLADALLQIAGFSAVLKIADAIDQTGRVKDLGKQIGAGVRTIETRFWTGTGYRTLWRTVRRSDNALDAADLVGFTALNLTGAGKLLDATRVQKHLETIKSTLPLSFPERATIGEDFPLKNEVLSTASVLNWSAVNLWAGGKVSESLDLVNGFYKHQSEQLNDAWHFFESFSAKDGKPWSNPHHFSHLGIWFFTLAFSGQIYNAQNLSLSFTARLENKEQYPFFTPEACGILSVEKSGQFDLQVLSGRLQLNELIIGDALRYRDVLLETGQILKLRA